MVKNNFQRFVKSLTGYSVLSTAVIVLHSTVLCKDIFDVKNILITYVQVCIVNFVTHVSVHQILPFAKSH
jgi:hypothetical protein